MMLRAYSLFDSKSLVYSPPFFQHTDGAAVRMIQDAVADPQSNVGRHPGDFVLFHIGTYDDQKGALASVLPLVHVVDAVSLVPKPQGRLFSYSDEGEGFPKRPSDSAEADRIARSNGRT